MKQKDIALIIVIVAISGLAAFFLSLLVFGSPSRQRQQVEVVEPITAEFQKPADEYFNENSVNPTKTIIIGDNPNPQPFNN